MLLCWNLRHARRTGQDLCTCLSSGLLGSALPLITQVAFDSYHKEIVCREFRKCNCMRGKIYSVNFIGMWTWVPSLEG